MTEEIMTSQTMHSDGIQDIIATVPSWILRWGITMFFLIIVLILGLSALIDYPDVIKTQLKIQSSNPPNSVLARTSGRLIKLFVAQDEIVKSGQSLGLFENSIDHNKYLLTSPISGRISFPRVLCANQFFNKDQEVVNIAQNKEIFFGEMAIPQDNMGKIMRGQQVLIKLKAYPYEEYGMINGRITYIIDFTNKDNVFTSKVDFEINNKSLFSKPIKLRQGMLADAEIITQESTILQRLTKFFFRVGGDR